MGRSDNIRNLDSVLVAVLLTSFFVSSVSTACPANDWSQWNNMCYKFFSNGIEWQLAQKHCLGFGANLVSIQSSEENNFVISLLGTRYAWIGLNDKAVEGTHTWIDGRPVVFTNWTGGGVKPVDSHGNEDCDMIYKNGAWSDSSCDNWWSYVCKYAPLASSDIDPYVGGQLQQQLYTGVQGQTLLNHIILRKKVSSLLHCASNCLMDMRCKSFNYKPRNDNSGTCQLNSETSDDFPDDLEESSGSVYATPVTTIA